MNILFVCNQGKHRSPTARDLYKEQFSAKSAGIYTDLSLSHLDWADLVVVMEDHQRQFIGHKFPSAYLAKQIICLEVPDIYSYSQPELIVLLQTKIDSLLAMREAEA